jgi:hypothetical protein
MATNPDDLCVTAYVLSSTRRNELRAREQGFTIDGPCLGGDEDGENLTAGARDTVDCGLLDQSQTALSDGSSSDENREDELDAEETELEAFVTIESSNANYSEMTISTTC